MSRSCWQAPGLPTIRTDECRLEDSAPWAWACTGIRRLQPLSRFTKGLAEKVGARRSVCFRADGGHTWRGDWGLG